MSTFLVGFGKPPRAGEVLPKILLIVLFFFFCRAGATGGDSEDPKDPLASPPPRYNPSIGIMVLGCITELGVSRPKVIRGRWYADQCIFATVSLSDCPRFLDSLRMRRWVSFHVPPPS
jgi:hypothetical protein